MQQRTTTSRSLVLLSPLAALALAHGMDRVLLAARVAAARTLNTDTIIWVQSLASLLSAAVLALMAWLVLVSPYRWQALAALCCGAGLLVALAFPLGFQAPGLQRALSEFITLEMLLPSTLLGHSAAFLACLGLLGLLLPLWRSEASGA